MRRRRGRRGPARGARRRRLFWLGLSATLRGGGGEEGRSNCSGSASRGRGVFPDSFQTCPLVPSPPSLPTGARGRDEPVPPARPQLRRLPSSLSRGKATFSARRDGPEWGLQRTRPRAAAAPATAAAPRSLRLSWYLGGWWRRGRLGGWEEAEEEGEPRATLGLGSLPPPAQGYLICLGNRYFQRGTQEGRRARAPGGATREPPAAAAACAACAGLQPGRREMHLRSFPAAAAERRLGSRIGAALLPDALPAPAGTKRP